MSIYFEYYSLMLVFAGALTGLALVFGARRLIGRGFSAYVRILVLLCALLACGSPIVFSYSSYPRLIFLVDESPSMAPYLPAIEDILAMSAEKSPTGCRIDVIGFSDTSRLLLDSVMGGTKNKVILLPRANGLLNLSEALNSAFIRVPGDTSGLIFLYTDGKFERADVRAQLPENIRIILRPLPPVEINDTALTSLSVPPVVDSEVAISAAVGIYSTTGTTAHLTAFVDDKMVMSSDFLLGRGSVEKILPITFSSPGIHVLKVQITSETPDSFPGNDLISRPVIVKGNQKVAIVAGRTDEDKAEAEIWRELIGESAFVTQQLEDTSEITGIVLVNTSSETMPEGIESFTKRGGSVLIVGGANAFDDDFSKTGLHRISPVEPDPSGGKTTSILFLVDKSGSLATAAPGAAYTRFQLVQAAINATMGLVNKKSAIGCIAFDSESHVIFDISHFASTAELGEAQRQLTRLVANGGTDLSKGLEKAYELISQSKADKRHLIVFHDGETEGGDYFAPLAEIRDAGVKVHFVAVGDARYDILSALANKAGGILLPFRDNDWERLPAIFKKIVEEIQGEKIAKGEFATRITKQGENYVAGELSLAEINALNSCSATDTSEVLSTAGDSGLPLIAIKTYGLGRCSAFTSSLRDSWALSWRSGDGMQMLHDLKAWTFPFGLLANSWLGLDETGGKHILRAEILDDNGEPAMNRKVFVSLGLQTGPEFVELQSYAPGRYSCITAIPMDSPIPATLIVNGKERGVFPLLASSTGDNATGEYRPEVLKSLARSLSALFVEGSVDITRSFPGRRSLIPLLAFLFVLLILLESLLALPALRRYLQTFRRRKNG